MAYRTRLCPIFIDHRNRSLGYVGGVLEFRKFNFRGLTGQFDAKIVNFRGPIALDFEKLYFRGVKDQLNLKKADLRGLIAEIGYLRLILAHRIHLCHIFNDFIIGNAP